MAIRGRAFLAGAGVFALGVTFRVLISRLFRGAPTRMQDFVLVLVVAAAVVATVGRLSAGRDR